MDTHIDTDLNMALAYINLDYTKYQIIKNITDDFSQSIKKPVLPNQEFDDVDIKLFNDFEEEVRIEDLIKRLGDKYYYCPNGSQSFNPKRFVYTTTIQKKQNYKISNNYNINVSCVDDPDSLNLSTKLEPIFSAPSELGLLPPNIKINSNKTSPYLLTTGTMQETDFVFIESPDGVYYDDTKETAIDYLEFFDNNTNVWVGCDTNIDYPFLNIAQEYEFKLKFPIISKTDIVKSSIVFDVSSLIERPGIVIHNLFVGDTAPVIIVEHKGRGFKIFSHSMVLNNPQKYSTLIYEVMMYVYLNSYKKIPEQGGWITYEVPDYEVVGNVLTKKSRFMSDLNLNNYLKLKQYEYIVSEVNIEADTKFKTPTDTDNDLIDVSSAIKLVDVIDGRLIFEMDKNITMSDYSEPKKPIGYTSVYSEGKVWYLPKIHYIIESDISTNTFVEEKEDSIEIKIYPFKSTKHGINTKYDFTLNIPIIKAENEYVSKIKEITYNIYIRNGIIRYIPADQYDKEAKNSVVLFTVEIRQTANAINIYDMRQLGGGLPEDLPDNYNLLDIGHINGRPYRDSSTLVITLPKRYEKFEKEIRKAIDEFKVGEDYCALFFEDKEEI